MSLIKAIAVTSENKATVTEVPRPRVRDGWVIVQVKAVAINPTDWKHIAWGGTDIGCRVGCDYAGIVDEVGAEVTSFEKGDRITGWIHGSNRADPESGAFAEYALAKACVQRKIPSNMTFAEAATLGVAIMTVGLGLYTDLSLPLPTSPAPTPFPLLIYGGSTATGMAGIQFATASNLTVLTTCSPKNFSLVRSLGASAAFDYASPTCGAEIRAATGNRLLHAWDCTGEGAGVCGEALSDAEDGVYGSIMPADLELLKKINPRVEGRGFVRGYDTMGERYLWLGKEEVVPDPEAMRGYVEFSGVAQGLLEEGRVKPLRAVVDGTGSGLEGALRGMKEMEEGRVSGVKLVYTL